MLNIWIILLAGQTSMTSICTRLKFLTLKGTCAKLWYERSITFCKILLIPINLRHLALLYEKSDKEIILRLIAWELLVVVWSQAVKIDITVYRTSSLLTLVGKETASAPKDIQDAFKELSLWDITGRRRQGPWSLNNLVASLSWVAIRTCNSLWCNTDSPEDFTVPLNNINFLFPDWLPVQPYIIPRV